VAEQIKKIARENGVPIVEKPEVARGIYKYVKVGQQIPSQFFGAVAEILAYLYKLDFTKLALYNNLSNHSSDSTTQGDNRDNNNINVSINS
jgi:flagellar biosynthesis protein FlhB